AAAIQVEPVIATAIGSATPNVQPRAARADETLRSGPATSSALFLRAVQLAALRCAASRDSNESFAAPSAAQATARTGAAPVRSATQAAPDPSASTVSANSGALCAKRQSGRRVSA